MKKDKILEIAWLVVILGLFFVSIKMLRSGELQAQIESFGIWAPIALVFLKVSTLVVAPLGGSPLYVVAGAVFGNINGFLLCFLGDVVGSTACFWISRIYGEKVVKIFAGQKFFGEIEKFLKLLNNTKSFLKARIALISLPEIFAYAAGFSRVGFWKFTLIHSAFMLPLNFGGVFLGSQIAIFASKYYFVFMALIALFAISGFSLLYKDYEKMEGM